jgi:hypothetical protein
MRFRLPASVFLCSALIAAGFCTGGCKTDPGQAYPYTEHGIFYLGYKSGLTSLSPQEEFQAGLAEVLQSYLKAYTDPMVNESVVDGITYELANLQMITGGVHAAVWDIFWEALGEYSYNTGSCWGFAHITIPSRGGTGTAYMLYTIIKYTGSVWYMAAKGDIRPKMQGGTQ